MTENLPDTPQDEAKPAGENFERNVAIFALFFFVLLFAGIGFVVKQVSESALPPPSFVPTGDVATQAEIERKSPAAAIDRPADNSPAAQMANLMPLKNPRRAYDQPIGDYDSDDKWRTVRGTVTAIVPRTDRMIDGSRRENKYARTEFYSREDNMNCYFHQYLGLVPTLKVHDHVLVQYDPTAADACGTARIVK